MDSKLTKMYHLVRPGTTKKHTFGPPEPLRHIEIPTRTTILTHRGTPVVISGAKMDSGRSKRCHLGHVVDPGTSPSP